MNKDNSFLKILLGVAWSYAVTALAIMVLVVATPDNFSWKTGDGGQVLKWAIASVIIAIAGNLTCAVISARINKTIGRGFLIGIMTQIAVLLLFVL